MSFGQHVVGSVVLLAIVVPLAFGAVRLRRRILPAWTGAPARLGEVVIGLAALVGVSEALGAVGLFRRVPLVIGALVAGTGMWLAGRPDAPVPGEGASRPVAEPEHRVLFAVPAAVAATALVVGQWVTHTVAALRTGIAHDDSIWYHLTRAARFAQDGWLTRLHFTRPEFPDTFHPANSEMLHGIGMVAFRRDVMSPTLGMAWLALALLAGWCLGRRRGVAPMTLVATAVLLGTPGLATDSAGTASNDILALGLLLAAAALLLEADGSRPALVLAAVAAGLGLGTKLTLLAPVGVLTLAVIAVAGRGKRVRAAVDWLVPLVLAGGYWYVRNLVHTGTPLPGLHLPGLPAPDFAIVDRFGYSVADYLTEGDVWSDWFRPGLRYGFGMAWPLLLALAGVGSVVALVRDRHRTVRALGVTSLVGMAAYVFTPTTALGAEGEPILFAGNLIYASPAVLLGLVLLPVTLSRSPRALTAVLVLSAVVLAGSFATDLPPAWQTDELVPGIVAALAVVASWAVALRASAARTRVPPSPVLAAIGVAVAAVVLMAAFPVLRSHIRARYQGDAVARWAAPLEHERIAWAGGGQQYRLYGDRLTNEVEYVGVEGDHGAYHDFARCERFRAALRSGRYDWVAIETAGQPPPPHLGWLRDDPSAREVLTVGTRYVFAFDADLDDPGCPGG